jgi:hypothetical protein
MVLTRKKVLHPVFIPLFQRFPEDCVVGEAAASFDDFPCFGPVEMVI